MTASEGKTGRKTGIHGAVTALVLLGVLSCMAIYAAINPESSVLFPKCPFHLLTGLECPGCGSQRALHCVLNGHFGQAAHYNILTVLAIPYIGLYAALEFTEYLIRPDKDSGRRKRMISHALLMTENLLYRGPAVRIILVTVLLFWILRNFTPAF